MRKMSTLHDAWYFTKELQESIPTSDYEKWEAITLPHTWNRYDGQDGGNDYYQGACWYVRELDLSGMKPEDEAYLEFHGAANACKVYVNGEKAAEHEGGYSIFRVPVTPFLSKETDKNIVSVWVSNEQQPQIYPQMADFTFYGGLYREVKLLFVPQTHFSLDFYGAEGITVTSDIIGPREASTTIHAFIHAPQEGDQVTFQIKDAEGKSAAELVVPAQTDTSVSIDLTDLHLWQGVEAPYLYQVEAILSRHNEVLDTITTRHGFRSFHVDPQKGFFLNGILTPLRGVSRHQDRLDKGNALTEQDHLEDALLIKEVGANTVRLAHYQHSQAFYDLCDEMGLIVWAEIPFISSMNPDPEAHQNCISQLKELIYQNYNHSSICFWGISNEITIGKSSQQLVENLKELNELVHELDPGRLSTMAQVSNLPMDDEQNQITDILSYNHYFGWYQGELSDNEKWLDEFHHQYPDRALGISEYGCEGIISYHNDHPQPGDYSEEYQALYHEHMAKVIAERPWLWATHVWNMFDFGCDARNEGGVAGRNNKGLVTLDRKIKKDSFYLYQAYWNPSPLIHICSKRYAKRTEETISIKVYSNQPELALWVNDEKIETQFGGPVYTFENVSLKDGYNKIFVKNEACQDIAFFEKTDEIYSGYLLEEDESETGVTNWFEDVDISQEQELTFDEAYYSIRDTMNELLENEETGNILINALSSITGMRLKKSMLTIMGEQSLENIGSNIPADKEEEMRGAVSYLNAALQEIKK